MKTEIKTTDEQGAVQTYIFDKTLCDLIWDAFLIAELQDEQWSDRDTCNLIVRKLTTAN